MHAPPSDLLASMLSFRYVLGSLGAANRGKTSDNKVSAYMACYGSSCTRMDEKQPRRGSFLSKSCRLAAKTRRLCEPLDELDAHRHHLCVSFCSMRDASDHCKLDSSALAPEYICLENEGHQYSFDIDCDRDSMRKRTYITAPCYTFNGVNMKRAIITAFLLNSVVVYVVHWIISLELHRFAHHLSWHLMLAQLHFSSF